MPGQHNIYSQVWSASQKQGGEKNYFDYFIYRRISTLFLIPLRNCQFSPNWITSASVLVSFVAAIQFFVAADYQALLWGVLWMNISLVLDTMDGQYSRLTGQQSEFGGWYDGVSDSLKYVLLFVGISCGAFYNDSTESQWFSGLLELFGTEREWILIAGMLVISNLFMVYYVHASRYSLSINPGKMVEVRGIKRQFHFGIESTLYTLFTIFLVAGQRLWLLAFLVVALPVLWIFPVIRVYQRARSS